MTLEQAIHQRWADSGPLAALLPADRVSTGRSSGASVPYATILREQGQTILRTNVGDALDAVSLRINVWHDRYDAGRTILDQVRAVFDRSRFDLSDGSRVLQMRRVDESIMQHSDGLWQLSLRFVVQVGR